MATSLRFTSRTAQQIREDLIRMIPTLAPSWTSHGEDEPGIALVDMLAGVADGLHYYFDKQALETYLPSVRLRKNAMSLSHLIGYRPRRTLAAQGTLRIVTTQALLHEVYIPEGTQFKTQAGVLLINSEPVHLPSGFQGVKTVPAVQGELRTVTIDSPGGTEAVIQLTDKDPSEQYFKVTTYGQPWVEFRDSQPEDPDNRWFHYFEDIDGTVSLHFLQQLGNVPMIGTPIKIDYLVSQEINISTATPVGAPTLTEPTGLTETELANYETSLERLTYETGVIQGYRAKESVSALRYSAPVSIKTKNRAVSETDYQFLARQVGGVKDLKVIASSFYTRQVIAYVLMEDGVDPDQDTLDYLQEYLDTRNDLTLDLVTAPANLQAFHCAITVKENEGYTSAQAVYEAREALTQYFRTTAANFGRTLRVGEVYSVANQPDSVQYVTLEALYWDGDAITVGDLVPTGDTYVPTIGTRLSVSPVV